MSIWGMHIWVLGGGVRGVGGGLEIEGVGRG